METKEEEGRRKKEDKNETMKRRKGEEEEEVAEKEEEREEEKGEEDQMSVVVGESSEEGKEEAEKDEKKEEAEKDEKEEEAKEKNKDQSETEGETYNNSPTITSNRKVSRRTWEIDMAEDSEEEEVIIRLKRPRFGVRRIVRVDVTSRIYATAHSITRMIREIKDSSFPDALLEAKEE